MSLLTRKEIIKKLRTNGWKKSRNGWSSPYHKHILQNISLREAASIECFSSTEDLS